MVLIIGTIYLFCSSFLKSLIHCKIQPLRHEAQKKNKAFREFKNVHPQYAFYVTKGGIEQTKFHRVHAMRRDFGLILEVCLCCH